MVNQISHRADHSGFWRVLQPFRFLTVVYGLAVAVGCWEFTQRQRKVDLYLAPKANFTDTFQELYPRRGESNYEKAIQTSLCLQSQNRQQLTPAACRQFDTRDLHFEVRRRFEQALRTQIKTEEGLYYYYLQILVGSEAAPQQIEAAYKSWRRNFPLSRLPDPRRLPR